MFQVEELKIESRRSSITKTEEKVGYIYSIKFRLRAMILKNCIVYNVFLCH